MKRKESKQVTFTGKWVKLKKIKERIAKLRSFDF